MLKEISIKLNDSKLKKLTKDIFYIMKILKNEYVIDYKMKNNISEILRKIKGFNIINFSRYADKMINNYGLNNIIHLLGNDDYI